MTGQGGELCAQCVRVVCGVERGKGWPEGGTQAGSRRVLERSVGVRTQKRGQAPERDTRLARVVPWGMCDARG